MTSSRRDRWILWMTTWLTVVACYCVLITGGVFAQNLSKLLTLWGDDIQMTAYLEAQTSEERILEIEKELKSDPRVGRLQHVSREKALEDFRAQMASYAPDLLSDPGLLELIPSSFQISLEGAVPTQQQVSEMEQLAQRLRGLAGIEEVRYGQEWIKKYSSVVSAFRGGTQLLSLILVLASLLVISNSVRAHVASRRQRIEVLELVGATPWMIRKPFLLEGALLGFSASLAALFICGGLFAALREVLALELQLLQVSSHLIFLSSLQMSFVLVGGTLVGLFSSYLCVRKMNDGWAASGATS